MNMILLFENDFVGADTVLLKDRRHDHLVSILKAGPGDRLKVGRLNGPLGEGQILETGMTGTAMSVVFDREPPAKIPLTVVTALPRPLVFRRIVSALTAFGVGQMAFIQTSRVEKSYWNSPALSERSVQEAVVSGLEQAGDTGVPTVSFHKRFKPFAEDVLPGLMEGRRAFVAHPQGALPCPAGVDGKILLAVGPEGGLTDYEVETVCRAGCEPVHLGQRILRVETALQALVGRLTLLSREIV